MTVEEFKAKIVEYNVPDSLYSLNDGLKLNSLILYQNYSVWEVFYMDEKSYRHDLGTFKSETEALDFFWQIIEKEIKDLPSTFIPRYNPY